MTKAKTKKRAKRAPSFIYVLLDRMGDVAGYYDTQQEAEEDAWGPRFFQEKYRVIKYARVITKKAKP